MTDLAPVVNPDDDDEAGAGPFDPPQLVPAAKPKRVRKSRAKGAAKAAPGAPVPVPTGDDAGTGERRPAVGRRPSQRTSSGAGKRESIADGASFLYNGAGQLAEATGGPATFAGRAMQMNAPAFGDAIDELLAGTFIDKKLQPLAQRGDKLRALKDIAGLPILALAIGIGGPGAYMALRPMLKAAVSSNITLLGPQLVKKKRNDDAQAKIMRELVAEGMLPEGPDGQVPTIDDLVDMLFEPPPEPPTPPPASGTQDQATA